MIKNIGFNEKITLVLSFLILNNYFLLSISTPILLVKINFFLYLFAVIIFYFRNITENFYLKLFFLLIVIISLGVPTADWDPRSNYLFHAKRIFYDLSIFSVADNYASFSHNEYPTLVPAFASSLAFFVGYWNEVLPKVSFTLIFLPPLILMYSFLKNTFYLIFLSIVFFTIGKFLFNGWLDGILAMYFCMSAFLMYFLFFVNEYLEKKKLVLYLIAFCFFITLTLIKNEGFVLLLIIFGTTFGIKIYQGNLKNDFVKLVILMLSFLPIIFWKLFCLSNGLGHEFLHPNILSNLSSRLADFNNFKIVSYFVLLNEKILFSIIFFLISCKISWDKNIFIFTSVIFVIYSAVLFFIFLSTPYDLFWQLNSSAARVIKSLSFFLAFFGLYNLRNYKIN